MFQSKDALVVAVYPRDRDGRPLDQVYRYEV